MAVLRAPRDDRAASLPVARAVSWGPQAAPTLRVTDTVPLCRCIFSWWLAYFPKCEHCWGLGLGQNAGIILPSNMSEH